LAGAAGAWWEAGGEVAVGAGVAVTLLVVVVSAKDDLDIEAESFARETLFGE
jgi:hypothetical protein